MHSLLKRQIKKYFDDSLKVPEEWQGFLEMVNNAYHEFDTDRNMLERSLELSSQELLQANTENIEMRITYKVGLPLIKADSAQINQILLNLVVMPGKQCRMEGNS